MDRTKWIVGFLSAAADVGSSPAPATNLKAALLQAAFFIAVGFLSAAAVVIPRIKIRG